MNPVYELDGVKIYIDEDPQNPRTEWDNLGTLICFHKRCNLGDKHDLNSLDYNEWSDLKKELSSKPCEILPVFMLDHSGLTINTTGFSCPWDSGQIGFIYCTYEKARKKTQWKRMSGLRKHILRSYLESEIETYNQYLQGEVYGFVHEVEPKYTSDKFEQIEKNGKFLFYMKESSKEDIDLVVNVLNKYDPSKPDSSWGFYDYTPEELAKAVLNGEI